MAFPYVGVILCSYLSLFPTSYCSFSSHGRVTFYVHVTRFHYSSFSFSPLVVPFLLLKDFIFKLNEISFHVFSLFPSSLGQWVSRLLLRWLLSALLQGIWKFQCSSDALLPSALQTCALVGLLGHRSLLLFIFYEHLCCFPGELHHFICPPKDIQSNRCTSCNRIMKETWKSKTIWLVQKKLRPIISCTHRYWNRPNSRWRFQTLSGKNDQWPEKGYKQDISLIQSLEKKAISTEDKGQN